MKLSRTQLLVSLAACAVLIAVAATPQLLARPVGSALHSLAGADPAWLSVAGAAFFAAFAFTVAAWRTALAAAGGHISTQQVAARIGIGSMVNSFAPAKLGDAVKVALCARAIDGPGRLWTTGGVYAGLGAARTLGLAVLVVAGSATGALPLWPVFALCGVVATVGVAAAGSRRIRRHERLRRLLDGFAALERSPKTAATVIGWTLAMVGARLLATICIVEALGLPHPLLASLVIMPALDLATVFPLTPGNIGIGSGAVAVALASRGIGMTQALGVGFAIQGVETLVSITVGGIGALTLAQPGAALRRWSLRFALVLGTAVAAASIGGVMVAFDLF